MSNQKLVLLSEVEVTSQEWLWPGRIPLRAITNLSGDPGGGKSKITYDLTWRVTTGQPMPGAPAGGEPAGVVLFQAEDNVASVVRPTLEALGADLNRVAVPGTGQPGGQPLSFPDDLKLLEEAVDLVDAGLVVVDPVTAYFMCNANSEQKVRQALRPLAELAEARGLAVLLVQHLNKKSTGNLMQQASGSMAWIAAARMALRVMDDPESQDSHRHLLLQIKTNLTSAPALGYRTVPVGGGQIGIEWLGETVFGVKDCLLAETTERTALREAMEILFLILQKKEMAASDAIHKAAQQGVAKRTLERAKVALGVKSERRLLHAGWNWCWVWRLPDKDNSTLARVRKKYEYKGPPVGSKDTPLSL